MCVATDPLHVTTYQSGCVQIYGFFCLLFQWNIWTCFWIDF